CLYDSEGGLMTWTSDLAREISGQVLTDDSAREATATDFGRLVVRKPAAVVRPPSTEDAARVVKFAARHGRRVQTRGAGHSQADNCAEIEVVTGDGEIVRCSEDQNRELFDSVRAGVGQFGIITEATLEVRRHKPGFRSYYLLYDDLNALFDDLKVLMAEERFDYIESWCSPCPQGFKKTAG